MGGTTGAGSADAERGCGDVAALGRDLSHRGWGVAPEPDRDVVRFGHGSLPAFWFAATRIDHATWLLEAHADRRLVGAQVVAATEPAGRAVAFARRVARWQAAPRARPPVTD